MKIFPPTSAPVKSSKPSISAGGKSGKKNSAPPIKKEMSEREIKEKLAAHVETSDNVKKVAIKNSKKLGDGFLNEEIKASPAKPVQVAEEKEVKTPNTEDYVVKSDIAFNDPKDPNTQEKLKAVLSKGAFNFNSREREALDKILADR